MKRNEFIWRILLFLVLGVSYAGCDENNDETTSNLETDSEGAGELPGDGDDTEGDESDREIDTDDEKGDPSDRGASVDFPAECTPSCQEACDRIEECGGNDHPVFPIDQKECGDRCLVGQNGPMWDDKTENFRCCASQNDCADVAKCGGWIAHPDTELACDLFCGCMFGPGSHIAEWAGVSAPEGYEFASNVVVVEQDDHSVDFRAVFGAEVISDGRYQFVKVPGQLNPVVLQAIEKREKIVPVFRDRGGRLAAAVGGIVVKTVDEKSAMTLKAFAKENKLLPPRELHYGRGLFYLPGDDGWRALSLLPAIENIDGVKAEMDMLRLYESKKDINDERYPVAWHLKNSGQDELAIPGVDARVTEAWDITMGDPDVVIGILDNGVDLYHPDLSPNLVEYESAGDFNYPEDWETYLADGFGFHGTPCAGIAAAVADNGEGSAGVCPGCSLMPMLLAGNGGINLGIGFQVTDQETADLFVKLVKQGAWIISNSWGVAGEDPTVKSPAFPPGYLSQTISSAFDYAETQGRNGKGTVILFATGNSNQNMSTDPYLAYPTVVGVGAVDDQGLKSYFSSYGSTVDIVAPSNGGITAGIDAPTAGVGSETNPLYTTSFGGTSAACPYVAGVMGLILSANKELTAAEAREILTRSATKIDPVWGKWNDDGFSKVYGYGLTNSYVAVRMALPTDACANPEDCLAPTDENCFEDCLQLGSCVSCRVDSNCKGDAVCQALPSVGYQICVSPTGSEGCSEGYSEVNGYCIPDRTTCNRCQDEEKCNGRDDNCNGEIDEIPECDDSSKRCLQNGEGCGEGLNCAATICARACEGDDDCGSGSCLSAKDRYGDISSENKICYTGTGLYCQMACQTLVSSLEENDMKEFVSCVEDDAYCANTFQCAGTMIGGK